MNISGNGIQIGSVNKKHYTKQTVCVRQKIVQYDHCRWIYRVELSEKYPKGVRREYLMEEFRRMKSYKDKLPAWYMFQYKSVEKLEGASLRHIQYWINKTGALVKMQTQIIKIQ